jgi:hypothetical protein
MLNEQKYWTPIAAGLARAKETLPCDFTFLIHNGPLLIPTVQTLLLSPLAHRLLIADLAAATEGFTNVKASRSSDAVIVLCANKCDIADDDDSHARTAVCSSRRPQRQAKTLSVCSR